MNIIITLLILTAIIVAIYNFVKNDGNREIPNSNPYGGSTPVGSQFNFSGSGSGSGKPLGKIEEPETVKEKVVKEEAPAKKKETKKPGAKRGRKPKKDQQDQLLLS
jgi:hypothetical protein